MQQNLIPFWLGGFPFLGIVIGMAIGLVTFLRVGAWPARTHIALIEKRRKDGGVDASSPEVSVKVVLLAWWVELIVWILWCGTTKLHILF